MAYLLTHFWPGGTEAEYRATVAAATDAAGGTLPESFHAAGPTDGGFLIAAVYESKEASDRFVQRDADAADADRRRPGRAAGGTRRGDRLGEPETEAGRARPYPWGVPDPLDGLTPAQREVAAHRGGPLLVVGAAGTGKTRALLARHAWLASAGGLAPEQVLALTASEAAADALRTGVEDELERGFEELAVHTVHGFGARLLRDEALEAGLDPFVVPVAPADRLAMLLERVDELTLQVHDFQGNPATLLASVIARIDRLKEAMVTADEVARWAAALPAGRPARRARARVRRRSTRPTTACCASRARSTSATCCCAPSPCCATSPTCARGSSARWRHVLVDDAQDLELAGLRLVARCWAASTAG